MYADMHMHQLDYSSDGHQTVSQIIQAAKAAGLMGFCITDHYDKEIAYRPDREEIFPLDRYFAALEPLRRSSRVDQPQLLIGIELGYQPHLASHYAGLTSRWPFDAVLLSLHLLDGQDPFDDRTIYAEGRRSLYRRYITRLTEMIEGCPDHDIITHFDYISRYAPYPDRAMTYAELSDCWDDFCRMLVRHDKCLEINVATIAALSDKEKPDRDAFPDQELIKAWLRLGGRRICLGSDAHRPEHIARLFPELAAWLSGLGVAELTWYERRQPRTIRLEQAPAGQTVTDSSEI